MPVSSFSHTRTTFKIYRPILKRPTAQWSICPTRILREPAATARFGWIQGSDVRASVKYVPRADWQAGEFFTHAPWIMHSDKHSAISVRPGPSNRRRVWPRSVGRSGRARVLLPPPVIDMDSGGAGAMKDGRVTNMARILPNDTWPKIMA